MIVDVIDIFCDGAALPTNPGPAGAGAVGFVDGKLIFELALPCGVTTNNVAEYTAVIEGLAYAYVLGYDAAHVYTDSRLVVEQFGGRWNCKSERLKPLLTQLWDLAACYQHVDLTWIPRDENEHADRLSREGIRPARQETIEEFVERVKPV